MTTQGLPTFKLPPKAMQEQAKLERLRRKACHGTWHVCTEECAS